MPSARGTRKYHAWWLIRLAENVPKATPRDKIMNADKMRDRQKCPAPLAAESSLRDDLLIREESEVINIHPVYLN